MLSNRQIEEEEQLINQSLQPEPSDFDDLELMQTRKKEDFQTELQMRFLNVEKDFQKFCEEHQNQKKDVYCTVCKNLICAHCFIWGRHQNHKVLNKEHLVSSFSKYKAQLDQVLERVSEKIEGSSGEFIYQFLNEQIKKKQGYFSDKIKEFIGETIQKIKEMQVRVEQEIETYFQLEKKEIEKVIKSTLGDSERIKGWQTKAQLFSRVFHEPLKNSLTEVLIMEENQRKFLDQGKIYEQQMTIELEKVKKRIEKSIRNVQLDKNEVNLTEYILFNCSQSNNQFNFQKLNQSHRVIRDSASRDNFGKSSKEEAQNQSLNEDFQIFFKSYLTKKEALENQPSQTPKQPPAKESSEESEKSNSAEKQQLQKRINKWKKNNVALKTFEKTQVDFIKNRKSTQSKTKLSN